MSEPFSSITPFSIFLGIAAIGFLYLAVTYIIGDFFEHGADFSHEVDTQHDLGAHDHGGPSILSSRVISVFIATFGSIGAMCSYSGVGAFVSSLYGFFGGLSLGWLVYIFARFLYRQQASSDITSGDLLGQTGTVTVTIPPQGLGQVRCIIGESSIEKIARSRDGNTIPYNTLVEIEGVEADAVVVRKVNAPEQGHSVVNQLFEEP